MDVHTADGFAERLNAVSMLEDNVPGGGRITLVADKGYAYTVVAGYNLRRMVNIFAHSSR